MTGRDEALRILDAGRRAGLAYRLLLRQGESEERDAKLQEAAARWRAAEGLVESLEDLTQRAVLRLRYLEGLRWPRVFDELEKLGLFYCERHVYRIHARALEMAGERLGHCLSAPKAASLEGGTGRGETYGSRQKNAG